MTDSACLHCGSSELRAAEPAQRWEHDGESHELLRCASCGGRFTNPLPSPALLDKLYGEDFNYGWYRDHYPAKLLDSLHRLWQYQRLGLLHGSRLLDYGGGLGYFSRAARLWKWDAETRDPMYDRGATTPGAGERFDVIACHHMLEHAAQPGPLLDRVREALAPDGTLIVAVPNGASIGYQRRGHHWVWSQPPFVHIHHFTAAGLRALLARHGFEVTGEHYFERWDANAFADVRLANVYARWVDGRWARARWRWGTAQLNSLLRGLALAATTMTGGGPPEERSELLLVARRGRAR